MTRVFKIFHKPISEQLLECLRAVEFISTRQKVEYDADIFIAMIDGVLHYNMAGAALIRVMNIRDAGEFKDFTISYNIEQFADKFNVPIEALVKFERRIRLLEKHHFRELLHRSLLHQHAYSFLVDQFPDSRTISPPEHPTFEDNPATWRLMVGKLIGALAATGY